MHENQPETRLSFRSARPQDSDYCARLYLAGMDKTIRELGIDMATHVAGFRKRWQPTQVRIIRLDRDDIGWLQTLTRDDTLFVAQLFVDAPFRRQGIGAEVMKRIIGEAAAAGQAVTLGVVKSNPALRLYRRLGFRITDEDDRKFYLRRNPAAPRSG